MLESLTVEPKKEIPKFDGKGNINYWLLAFNSATEANPDKRVKLLLQALIGPAGEWFCSQKLADGDTQVTYEQWVERLKSYFGRSRQSFRQALAARKQRENETPDEYVRDVLRLCNEADPSMHEDLKLSYLQKGLLPKYEEKMFVMDPETTSEFREKLDRIVTRSQEEKVSESDKTLLHTLVTALVDKKAEPATPSSIEAKLDRLIELMTHNQRQSGQSRPRGNLTCFKCGKPGHLQRFCRSAAAKTSVEAGPSQTSGNEDQRQ